MASTLLLTPKVPALLDYTKWQLPAGDRVYLTHTHENDLETLYTWFVQSNEARMTCRPFRTPSLQEWRQNFKNVAACRISIRRVIDDQLIGRLTCFDPNPRNRSVEIGYLTGPTYRQQGYTKEALKLLLSHLFRTVGFNKVMAQTGVFNQASIALLRTLGFQQEGRLRQHHLLEDTLYDDLLFSLLAAEFPPKP